jgi:hypothetical protein
MAELFEAGSREPIRLETVLVVEGRDMFGFFLAMLRELNLDHQIEVRNGGGTPDLYDYLGDLKTIAGFAAVTSLGVVCDCEADPVVAFRDLCNGLRRASLAVPAAVLTATATPPLPRITVHLLPDANTPGMLETLLWRALAADPLFHCVEEYLDCVRKETGQLLSYEDKSRIYAYIAGRDQPWLLLGQAARARYFPWMSPVLDDLRTFLQGLL